jgi:TonB family protein
LDLRSVIIVPVLRQGKVSGLIEVFSNKPNAFRNEDVAGLQLLANQCSSGEVAQRPGPEPEVVPLKSFSAAPQERRFRLLKYRTIVPWVVGAVVLIGGAGLAFHHSGPAAAEAGNTQRQPHADLAATTPGNAGSSQPNVGIPRELTEAFFGRGDAAARSVIRKQRMERDAASNAENRLSGQSGSDQDVLVRQVDGATDSSRQNAPAQPEPVPAGRLSDHTADADLAPPALNTKATPDEKTLAVLNVPSPALPSAPVAPASEVTPARLVHTVKPGYPISARASNIQGSVVLLLKVDAAGRVRDVTVLSGSPELANAAVAAVRQWRYAPFKLNGKPVDGETNVTVNFSIHD